LYASASSTAGSVANSLNNIQLFYVIVYIKFSYALTRQRTTQQLKPLNLNLKQLEAFVWAVDLGSFSKAATRLNTTQPNISIRVRALEDTLNVQLLERDAGSVRLTAKGKELLEYAQAVLNSVDKLISFSGDEALRSGTLRLGVTEMIVHTWLQDFLKALNERFPNIQVELTVDMSANLSKELSERGLDLALQNGPFDQATSGNRELGTYPLIWVASPDLGLPKTKTLSKADMSAHPILTHSRDSFLFKKIADHFKDSKTQQYTLVPSSNLAACHFMAINNMGVATLPKAMVKDSLAKGEIIELNYEWKPESLAFKARYDAKKSPQYVASIAELAQQISRQISR